MNDANLGWFVRSRGRVLGPFQFPQLEVLKIQGRLAKFDEVSRDRRTWVQASSLPELFPPPAPAVAVVEPGYAVASDPSAASDKGTAWFYMGDQGQNGPVVLSELVRLAGTGVVQAETYVWHSELSDWTPAREVPALGLKATPPPRVATAAPPAAATPARGSNPLALNGFILGVVGLLTGVISFLSSALASAAEQNRDVLAMMSLGLGTVWVISSVLAAILGTIGMVRASRAGGDRPGFGLGLTGMILGIVGLTPVLILIFFIALAMIVSSGANR